ncbi:MAG: 2-hydroxyacyl-CoA dehydratase family protein [Proteobacteria bacterium]|nr:2-hydroxyacyl-CoA dehydratase family protein [Pseudomonadota bacterium]MBU1596096.1 2-hydroxyacyl-CoA dehydratase family protein [Pseudomonadota bacterium]
MTEAAKAPTLAKFASPVDRFHLELEPLKEAGVKLAGIYCVFAPVELVRAAGAVSVGLCGKKQGPIPDAERVLPANLCPLIKSSYGYAATGTCPYFNATDFILAETTCDGKKKMFELMDRIKPVHMMRLPTDKSPEAQALWLAEMRRLAAFLAQHTGKAVTDEALRREIALQNRIRRALLDVAAFMSEARPPISSLDLMGICESRTFVLDQEAYLNDLLALGRELEELRAKGSSPYKAGAPRILVTGTPVGRGSEKVLRLLEDAGAVVVVLENCTGLKGVVGLVDENAEPMEALAKRYLDTPCSCMSPNTGRFTLIDDLTRQYRPTGVVDLVWQACHTYSVESFDLGRHVTDDLGLPFLKIETDYTESDVEQLRTRIEAFLELQAL